MPSSSRPSPAPVRPRLLRPPPRLARLVTPGPSEENNAARKSESRAGKWLEPVLRLTNAYTTSVLPEFAFACAPVFEAAHAVGGESRILLWFLSLAFEDPGIKGLANPFRDVPRALSLLPRAHFRLMFSAQLLQGTNFGGALRPQERTGKGEGHGQPRQRADRHDLP